MEAKRIKIIDSFQGEKFSRVIDEVWQRLLTFDGGEFYDYNDRVEIFTTEGKKAIALKNLKFILIKSSSEYFVEKNELDFSQCIMDNLGNNKYRLRSVGLYDPFGKSFQITFETVSLGQ